MNYCIVKLHFSTPVHFGGSGSAQSLPDSNMGCCSDTLFSALCQTALRAEGDAGIAQLYRWATGGKLRLSDALPWKNDTLYLPRPCLEPSAQQEFSASDRKVMKKLAYLGIPQFAGYLAGLQGKKAPDPNRLAVSFGEKVSFTRAAVTQGQDTLPYTVGAFRFDEDCGLYLLVGYEGEEVLSCLKRWIALLQLTGLGGKVSSGFGKFEAVCLTPDELPQNQGATLLAMLRCKTADRWIALNACLPQDDELEQALEGAGYRLVRRSGFVQSTNPGGPLKKREQYFLTAGSAFTERFRGDVYNVAPHGCHNVYRYGIPMLLGVML